MSEKNCLKKRPKARPFYGAFFLVSAAGTIYASNVIVDFFHLIFVYGFHNVLSNDLHFLYKRMIITVSNGDHLSIIHSLLNFIAVCILWMCLLIGVHFLAVKVFRAWNFDGRRPEG